MEEIVKEYYSSPEQKEVVDDRIQILKKNDLFTLEHWKKLTPEQKADLSNFSKTKDTIPTPLSNLLDEVMKGIIRILTLSSKEQVNK